jgi:hypothetical protein
VALAEKQLAFESRIMTRSDLRSAEYLAINPKSDFGARSATNTRMLNVGLQRCARAQAIRRLSGAGKLPTI